MEMTDWRAVVNYISGIIEMTVRRKESTLVVFKWCLQE